MRGFLALALYILLLSFAPGLTWGASKSFLLKPQHLGLLKHYDRFVQQGVPEVALRRSLEFFYQVYGRTFQFKTPEETISMTYKNDRRLVIIDFSQSSLRRRLYLLNLKTGDVEKHLVSHGVNSGGTMAYRFSNIPDSRQTSLGFYMTGELYQGKFGPALKLFGLEASNDKAFERYIVMHGAHYVSREFVLKRGYLGRSHGCPAVEKSVATKLLPLIAEGTLVFAYHKDLSAEALLHPLLQKLRDTNPEDDNPEPTREELEQTDDNPYAISLKGQGTCQICQMR